MQHATRRPILAAVMVALPWLMGCAAPVQLSEVWTEPNYSGGTPTNALVTALRGDPIRRRRWEDAFASALARRGVRGTTSYSLWPDAPPDTQQVVEAVKQNHFDAVLTLVRLENRTVTTTTPGQVHREPVTYVDAWGRAYTQYRDVREPDRATTETVLGFQSDLWRTSEGDGRLVWSGTVRVDESVARNLVNNAVEKGIMPGLAKSGIVPKPKGK